MPCLCTTRFALPQQVALQPAPALVNAYPLCQSRPELQFGRQLNLATTPQFPMLLENAYSSA